MVKENKTGIYGDFELPHPMVDKDRSTENHYIIIPQKLLTRLTGICRGKRGAAGQLALIGWLLTAVLEYIAIMETAKIKFLKRL